MFKKWLYMICGLCFSFQAGAADIMELPVPDKSSSLMKVIDASMLNGEVFSGTFSEQTISDLLWAAFGFNSKGTRTILAAPEIQNLKVFVVYKNSIWSYDAAENTLLKVSDEEMGQYLALQDAEEETSVSLIYTGNDAEYSAFNAGAAAQNVSLYAADKGFHTVVRRYIDKDELKDKLRLDRGEFVIMNQLIGTPKG